MLDATGVVIESTSISAPIFFHGKYDSRVGMANCGLESGISEEKYRGNIAQNSMQIFFFFFLWKMNSFELWNSFYSVRD